MEWGILKTFIGYLDKAAEKLPDCREAAPRFRRLIPETRRTLNGLADSILRLTLHNFKRVVRFACELCME